MGLRLMKQEKQLKTKRNKKYHELDVDDKNKKYKKNVKLDKERHLYGLIKHARLKIFVSRIIKHFIKWKGCVESI